MLKVPKDCQEEPEMKEMSDLKGWMDKPGS